VTTWVEFQKENKSAPFRSFEGADFLFSFCRGNTQSFWLKKPKRRNFDFGRVLIHFSHLLKKKNCRLKSSTKPNAMAKWNCFDFILKISSHCARKCFRYMDAYRLGLSGKKLEFAVKKYKSHRKIPLVFLIDSRFHSNYFVFVIFFEKKKKIHQKKMNIFFIYLKLWRQLFGADSKILYSLGKIPLLQAIIFFDSILWLGNLQYPKGSAIFFEFFGRFSVFKKKK